MHIDYQNIQKLIYVIPRILLYRYYIITLNISLYNYMLLWYYVVSNFRIQTTGDLNVEYIHILTITPVYVTRGYWSIFK